MPLARALEVGRRSSRAASSSRRSRSCRRAAWTRRACSPTCAAQGRRRRRGERARRPARAEPHGRAADVSLLIEQQVGIETVTHYCCRDRNLLGMLSDLLGASAHRAAQPAAHHRRSAEDGAVSRRDGGVRHRRDRAHEPRAQPEPRPRSGRQPDRRADALRDRRRREPGARSISTHELQALRVEGRGGRRVRDHAAGVRRRRSSSSFLAPHRATRASRSSPASGRWCRCATRSSSPTRCRASTVPDAIIERMRTANEKSQGARGRRRDRDRARDARPRARRACRACRCRRRSGRSSWRSRCSATRWRRLRPSQRSGASQ